MEKKQRQNALKRRKKKQKLQANKTENVYTDDEEKHQRMLKNAKQGHNKKRLKEEQKICQATHLDG